MIEFLSYRTRETMFMIYLLYQNKLEFRPIHKFIANIVKLHLIITRKRDTLTNGAHDVVG